MCLFQKDNYSLIDFMLPSHWIRYCYQHWIWTVFHQTGFHVSVVILSDNEDHTSKLTKCMCSFCWNVQFSSEIITTGSSDTTESKVWIDNCNAKLWKSTEYKLHKIWCSTKFQQKGHTMSLCKSLMHIKWIARVDFGMWPCLWPWRMWPWEPHEY